MLSFFAAMVLQSLQVSWSFGFPDRADPADPKGMAMCNPSSGLVMTGSITVYPIFVSSGANPFTATQEKFVKAWISGLNNASSPVAGILANYPDKNGVTSRTFLLGASCDTTSWNNGSCGATEASNNITPNGCGLPSDANAVYLSFLSDTSFTATTCHGSILTTSAAATVAYAAIASSAIPTPTNYPAGGAGAGFDGMMVAAAHEFGEAVTDPDGVSGWRTAGCALSTNEVWDVCEGMNAYHDYAGNWLGIAPNGQPYNYHVVYLGTDYYFPAPAAWDRHQCSTAGTALHAQATACSNTPACGNAPSIGFCSSTGKCIVPTCSDGYRDGDESDVDCGANCNLTSGGGFTGALCATGKKCVAFFDCASSQTLGTSACSAGTCL